MGSLYIALVHYPVVNRRGETIASAITNLDLHDLARAACTYDVPVCYIVTPLRDQQVLSEELLSHWCKGVGREIHPDRAEALRRLRVVESIGQAVQEIEAQWSLRPLVWASSAQDRIGTISHRQARKILAEEPPPCLVLFGTAWGLAPSVCDGEVDGVLEPIRGLNGYNHLSVRCAAAILMDRLLRSCE